VQNSHYLLQMSRDLEFLICHIVDDGVEFVSETKRWSEGRERLSSKDAVLQIVLGMIDYLRDIFS
jgi:hypothetical protein